MDEAGPDNERELTDVPRRRLAGPLLFSAGLHAGVLLLFARTVFSVAPGHPPAERPAIQVALALRSVPPDPAEPLSLEPSAAEQEPLPAPPPTATGTVAEAAPAGPAAPAEDASANGADSGTIIQPWTAERVRAELETSSAALRSTLTGEWIAACIRERKERGTQDCEEQREQTETRSAAAAAGMAAAGAAFASVTRPQQQRRLRERYMKSNDAIRGLVDAGGVLGDAAAARYWLNRDYLIYLGGNRVNGNHNDMVFAPMQNFAADALNGPNLSLSGDVPFACRSRKIDYSVAPATGRVTLGNNVPCTYEFTGFTIERPEPDPDAFRVVPPVLGDPD